MLAASLHIAFGAMPVGYCALRKFLDTREVSRKLQIFGHPPVFQAGESGILVDDVGRNNRRALRRSGLRPTTRRPCTETFSMRAASLHIAFGAMPVGYCALRKFLDTH